MILRASVGFFAVLITSISFAATPTMTCTSYRSTMLGKDVKYCYDRSTPETLASPGEPVVYFMHGTNGGAKTWKSNNYETSLAKLRASPGKLPPATFISFNTSAYSFFSDRPVKPGSNNTHDAYETWFVEEFMPYIEKTFDVCHVRACRGIIGESMGGYGAIKTALRHPELFSVIAVNSPALSPFTEDRPFWDWAKYYMFKPIGPIKGFLVASIFLHIFPTAALFDASNPTWLVDHYDSTYPFPDVYFDMGGKDSYGFYDGYALFKAALDRKEYKYKTLFEASGHHDMWKRHAVDALKFTLDHVN
jgi:pimeloyl-ACP methyl ester carboxylesterase